MSWLSSLIGGVGKAVSSVVDDAGKVLGAVAPTLIKGVEVAGLGALTGGAAFGTASILTDSGLTSAKPAGNNGLPTTGGINGSAGIGGQTFTLAGYTSGGQPEFTPAAAATGGTSIFDIGGDIAGIENYISTASHNVETQGIRIGIYAVLILFMLGAFIALVLPDEQQSVNILDSGGKLAALGA